uniref:Serine/threonine-protein phosphatase n=1 Tax=Coturnix japonica TaxID=93934 RepID=A0A8C2SX94_COTJA
MAERQRAESGDGPGRHRSPGGNNGLRTRPSRGTKDTANEYFKGKQYEEAVELYSRAIELNPTNAIYYGNRSLAYLRTECYGYALADATRAIELDSKYIKGCYRRAASNMALGKVKAALRDYETVVKVRPNDKDAKLKYQECNKIVKQKAFERAIASDEHKRSVVDSLDIESMTIEDEYSGPKLEGGKVTLSFMQELMQWYKDQKKLHRKCAYQILVQVKEVLSKLPTLVETTLKETEMVTVCGDTHGQFYDLLNIFELNGLPSESNPYIFNGDFVDRGSFSVEVILTLFGFKLLYPDHFHLLRGNHETDNMNQIYGFEGEVKAKYTAQMFALFSEVFEWLPLAQCINGKVLVSPFLCPLPLPVPPSSSCAPFLFLCPLPLPVPPSSYGCPFLFRVSLPVLGVPSCSRCPLYVPGVPSCSGCPFLFQVSLPVLGVPSCSGCPFPFWVSHPLPPPYSGCPLPVPGVSSYSGCPLPVPGVPSCSGCPFLF